MTNPDFSEIDQMHAVWSKMDNISKLTLLTEKKIRLSRLANQMAQYVSANGGFMNSAERAYARKLLDMFNSLDTDRAKVMDEVRNDVAREITKEILKHL